MLPKKMRVRIVFSMLFTFCLAGCQNSKANVPDLNGDGKLSCTLEVRCNTILDNMQNLKPGKEELIPEDGLLLDAGEIEFKGGNTVFDVLRREITSRKLHYEYTESTAYRSAYIEGICNIYEFDCGSQSGWMYCVNGVFPSVGCSQYTLSDGDVIQFLYTCDRGQDIGGSGEP